jgi:pimeloyl-ACP methyl ester carboxylesterase
VKVDPQPGRLANLPSRSPIVKPAAVLLALYGAVLVLSVLLDLPDRIMLRPHRLRIDARGATRLGLAWSGGEVEVWKARTQAEPEAYVLRFYGNADRADRWVADEPDGLPFAAEVWGVNYPGFGGSTGASSLRAVGESALVAYDALAKVAGDKPIFVFGTSMGTAAALHVAAERKVAGAFLLNPPALRQMIVGDHGWWNLWLLAYPLSWRVPPSMDSVANAAKCRAPATFVMSGEDEVVALRYQEQVWIAYAGPKQKQILAGAHHNDPLSDGTRREINRQLLQMIARP